MHTINMFDNNNNFVVNTCKNPQCIHELSGNLMMKKMTSHFFILESD